MTARVRVTAGLVAVGLVILIAFPLVFSNPTTTSIAVFTLVFMVSASAWNMFSGYSGYIALGHAVYFGTGAYTLALAATHLGFKGGWDVFALVPAGGLVAGLVAIPTGLIALRARRHTFVVITIAFMFIFQLFAYNLTFTGGSSGIQVPTPFPTGSSSIWSAATYNDPFYYVTALILVLTIALSWLLRGSRFGLQLLAIRDDEERARGLGVNVGRVKLTAFVLSSIPVGMAGAVYAYFLGQIFPNTAFDPLFDLSIALMAFMGGLGTVFGPVLGALVLESLQQYFTLQYGATQLYLIIYGALFLAIVLVLPRGVIPSVEQLVLRWRTRASVQEPTAEEPERQADVIKAAGAR
jgi:branched-chain amino acid transport system permease protein